MSRNKMAAGKDVVIFVVKMMPDVEDHIREEDFPGGKLVKIMLQEQLDDVYVKELEDPEIAKTVEILNSEPCIIAKYHSKLPSLKWAHTESNDGVYVKELEDPEIFPDDRNTGGRGVNEMVKALDPEKPLPTFTFTKTSGKICGPVMSEFVLGHILARERKIQETRKTRTDKQWQLREYFLNCRQLSDLTVGILGVGNIGKEVAKTCKAFGMTVWGLTRRAVTRQTRCPYVDEYRTAKDLSEILENSDYVCSILPGTSETKDLLSGDILANCKAKKSVFISTGRGDVVDEASIVKAIKNGWIAAAILDVLPVEPPPESSPLWDLPEVTMTQHVAGCSLHPMYMNKLNKIFIDNYHNYIQGKPLNGIFDWTQQY